MTTFRAIVGQHFAFAAGRATVLKDFLLTQSDVDRLLGSHSLAECERIVRELRLTSSLDAETLRSDADTVLAGIERWMRAEVEGMTPVAKRPVFATLWLTGDAPLLAYALKHAAGLTSSVSTPPTPALTVWDPAAITTALTAPQASSLPASLLAFIAEVQALPTPTATVIDRAVARWITARRLALARSSGSNDILRYVRHSIDITNIRTALRFSEGIPIAEQDALLPGGTLSPSALRGGTTATEQAIAASELYAPFARSSQTTTADTPLDIEAIGARILADDIARMWLVPLTVEPIFAFAAMVMANVRLLRAIVIGKRNALSPQEVKRILPPFIPASHFIV